MAASLGTYMVYIYLGDARSKNAVLSEVNQELALARPTFSPDATIMATFLGRGWNVNLLNATAYSPLSLVAAKNGLVNLEDVISDYAIRSVKFTPAHWIKPISSDYYPHCLLTV